MIGVDTHKYTHVAVAVDEVGAVIVETTIAVNRVGYAQLQRWTGKLSAPEDQVEFGICRAGYRVVEVNRPDRGVHHRRGKDDSIDTEIAALTVLSGAATAVSETADGTVEMIFQVKSPKDSATKALTQRNHHLKTILVNARAELREILQPLGDRALIEECRKLRYESMLGPSTPPATHCAHSPTRYHGLEQETRLHDRILATLIDGAAPP